MYLSIDHLEVWRNFEEKLWSQDDLYKQPLELESLEKLEKK